MLTRERLAAGLRRDTTSMSFTALLLHHTGSLPSLRDLHTGAQVLHRLDQLRLFDPVRDELVADLIRLRRASSASTAWAAAMYAVLPGVAWAAQRLAGGTPSADRQLDAFNQCLEELHEVLVSFNPDTRSAHVLAGIQRDVFGKALKRRKKELHAERTTDELTDKDGCRVPFAASMGERKHGKLTLDAEDVELGRLILGAVAAQHGLSETELYLLEARALRRRSTVDLGRELGVDRRTVERQIDRLLARVGDVIRSALLPEDARF